MNLFITGAGGFIGSACVRHSRARGHQVIELDGRLGDCRWPDVQPEACLHAAWIATPGLYLESPENERLVRESEAFLKQCARRGTQRFFVLGSCIEYRMGPEPLSEETTPLQPQTLYARSKVELRRRLRDLGLPVGWGRVFYPYGPGEHPDRLCSSLVRKLSRGEKLILKTPHSCKDYIYIEDLAEAIVLALEQGVDEDLNLGTGHGHSVGHVARTLARLLGREELVVDAEPPDTDPFPCVVADTRRLRALGWKPRTPLEEGLAMLNRALH